MTNSLGYMTKLIGHYIKKTAPVAGRLRCAQPDGG